MEQFIVQSVNPDLTSSIISVHTSHESAIDYLTNYIDIQFKPSENSFKVYQKNNTLFEIYSIGYILKSLHSKLQIVKIPTNNKIFSNNNTYMLNPQKPPGENFKLSNWELDLPVKNGDSIEIISGNDLSKGYTSNYFYTDELDGAMTFKCPSNGGTTPNSHYPRTELREIPAQGEWEIYNGNHSLSATLNVVQLPSNKGIIIGQIHGTDNKLHPQMVKLMYGIDNNIYVELQTDFQPGLEQKQKLMTCKLGDKISYILNVTNISSNSCKINVSVNDKQISFTYKNKYWKSDKFYFKAGNYLQDNSPSADDIGIIKLYSLNVQHSK